MISSKFGVVIVGCSPSGCKVEGGRNWETPDGVDWKCLRSHLLTALETFSEAETVCDLKHPLVADVWHLRIAPNCSKFAHLWLRRGPRSIEPGPTG